MKQLRTLSRILVGLVFIFSGFVKAVDPVGSFYKFEDYFLAFGLENLASIALFPAFLLFTLEFVIGMALTFNARILYAAWGALIFMIFFTPLTLVLALTNPVTDCGCFGDALKLTNWETFLKNIVILALTLVVFFGRKTMPGKITQLEQHLFLELSTIFILVIGIYSYRHLPIIDFRPYHIGANISENMSIPEGAPTDEYKTILYYEKDGIVEEFDQSNYPWQDTTWKYVDSKQIKIKEGYHPKIYDFSISNEIDGDITDIILNDEGYTFLLVVNNLEESNIDFQDKLNALAAFCLENGYRFICITASLYDEIEDFRAKYQPLYKFYNTDEIQLKTMIRSNPGLMLLRKGTILNKWHYNDFPTIKELNVDLTSYAFTRHQHLQNKLKIISIASVLLLILCFYLVTRHRKTIFKNKR